MKHLKKFENYSEFEIKNMLVKSQKKQDIEIKTSIDNVMNNLMSNHDVKLIGTFKGFVIDEGNFISEGDKERMKDYIQEFKKLGINTSKAEKLLPNYIKFWKLNSDLAGWSPTKSEEQLYMRAINTIESLENDVDDFEIEIKRLAKEAKKLL